MPTVHRIRLERLVARVVCVCVLISAYVCVGVSVCGENTHGHHNKKLTLSNDVQVFRYEVRGGEERRTHRKEWAWVFF